MEPPKIVQLLADPTHRTRLLGLGSDGTVYQLDEDDGWELLVLPLDGDEEDRYLRLDNS